LFYLKSRIYNKKGILSRKQRYSCKSCGYHYAVMRKKTAKPDKMKKQALHLYLAGLGFRAIGHMLGFSQVSAYRWIKKFGQPLDSVKSNGEIEVMEIDELHT